MIFFGSGSLLKKALIDTLDAGSKIDFVVSANEELIPFCQKYKLRFKRTGNINSEKDLLLGHSSDGIVFSINNGQLFEKNMLSIPDFNFFNIHNGLIPKYRGLPEICIFFAILNQEQVYGVSLHKIDIGIDTGTCYDQLVFDLNSTDTFQDVMLKGISSCEQIFSNNFQKVLNREIKEVTVDKTCSKLYTYKDLESVPLFKNNINLMRAKKFGIFKAYYPKAFQMIEKGLME